MSSRTIYVTADDAARLGEYLRAARFGNTLDRQCLDALDQELRRARIVESHKVPADLVTMNSCVRMKDLTDGTEFDLMLVFPSASDMRGNKVSVVAPLGAAIIGYRAGQIVRVRTPGGVRRYQIMAINYQPESAELAGKSDT